MIKLIHRCKRWKRIWGIRIPHWFFWFEERKSCLDSNEFFPWGIHFKSWKSSNQEKNDISFFKENKKLYKNRNEGKKSDFFNEKNKNNKKYINKKLFFTINFLFFKHPSSFFFYDPIPKFSSWSRSNTGNSIAVCDSVNNQRFLASASPTLSNFP